MEPHDPEGVLMYDRFQYRDQMQFADRLRAADHLPLRHRVHGVDVIHPRPAVVLPLMHGVHAQISWSSFRLWPTTFPDGYLTRSGVLHAHPNLSVCRRLA